MSEPTIATQRTVVQRHRTAIRRYRMSRPVRRALAEGLITAGRTFFDYGCGYGEDVQLLEGQGIHTEGWAPHYRPNATLRPADVVNLGYVLNVIEDKEERAAVLRRAFELTNQVLVVSVRVDESLGSAEEFGDGWLTNSCSFQKIYSQAEFRSYLESTLQVRPHIAGLGIAYLFKDRTAETAYLGSLAFSRRLECREDLVTRFSDDPVAKSYVTLAQQLGRRPLADEFPELPRLVERFGTLSRIERLSSRVIDPGKLAGSQAERRDDILTYLSMFRLQGLKPPPFGSLPLSVRADFKALWPNYRAAIAEGDKFLFQLGQPHIVKAACLASPIGKFLPENVYVHRSAEELMPALMRVLLFAARQIVGDVGYNVIKVALDGRKISLLSYSNFDDTAHPELQSSVKVYLPTACYSIRDYSNFENPPILHRKEQLVAPSYPNYEVFRQATEKEEQLGLLSAPDIGYRQRWLEILSARKLVIEGHEIRSSDPP